MKYLSSPTHRFIVDGAIYNCDYLARAVRGVVSETLTAEGKCLTRRSGNRSVEVVAKGWFDPADIDNINTMMKGFNDGVTIFVVDNEQIHNPALLEGRAWVEDGGLGRFIMRFGGLYSGVSSST